MEDYSLRHCCVSRESSRVFSWKEIFNSVQCCSLVFLGICICTIHRGLLFLFLFLILDSGTIVQPLNVVLILFFFFVLCCIFVGAPVLFTGFNMVPIDIKINKHTFAAHVNRSKASVCSSCGWSLLGLCSVNTSLHYSGRCLMLKSERKTSLCLFIPLNSLVN